ncbi:MAG: type I 3-dehydroquinate dehydratase [Halobacteriota archaeon]
MLDVSRPLVVASITSDLGERHDRAVDVGADAVELRFDLYDGDALDDLRETDIDLPVISTYRDREDVSHDERVGVLRKAVEHSEAVDVDVDSPAEVREPVYRAAESHDVTRIASSHYRDGTPDASTLRDVLDRGLEAGDLAKLAVTAATHEDVHRLLGVTLDYRGRPVATMAMGGLGSYSRFLAPVYGSRLTYGSLGDPTAPGQLSVEDVVDLLARFDGGRR